MASSCSVVGVPGMDTTMFLPPWVAISASETPLASMRCRMMSTAWSIWPELTCWLFSSTGSRTISVPPSRSRPSRGVEEPLPQAAMPPARAPRLRTMISSASRCRRADRFVFVRATNVSLT